MLHIKPPLYRAYLLRMWEERGQATTDGLGWRFSLEDTQTGARYGFANLEQLNHFLKASTMHDELGDTEA